MQKLRDIDFSELSELQFEILKKYDLDRSFGKAGADFIEDCLYKNSLDITTAHSELNKQNSQINQCLTVLIKTNSELVCDIFNGCYSNTTTLKIFGFA